MNPKTITCRVQDASRRLMYFAAAPLCSTVLSYPEAHSSDSVDKKHVRIGVVQLEEPYFYLDCLGPTMEYLREKYPEIRFSFFAQRILCCSFAPIRLKTNLHSDPGAFSESFTIRRFSLGQKSGCLWKFSFSRLAQQTSWDHLSWL